MFRGMGVLIACLALAVAAWAGDPWKEKSYKEWDEKEAHKILNDSPWARVAMVPAMWQSGGGDPAGRGGGGGGAPGEGGMNNPQAAPSTERGGTTTPTAVYVVRWASARTAREALARLAVLRGTPEAEADKVLHLPVTEHVFLLYGTDMVPFAKGDEKSLTEMTYIRPKKSKVKISPVRVEIKKAPDGKRISALLFYFSMKSAEGEPVIAPDEKGVEFECRTAAVTVRQTFEPQKMVSKAGPDWQ